MAVVTDFKHQVEIGFQSATQRRQEVLCLESRVSQMFPDSGLSIDSRFVRG